MSVIHLLWLMMSQIVIVTGLQCYSCLDVTILETERQNSAANSVYDILVNAGFGGLPPAACDTPSLVNCSESETCFSIETTASGAYSDINGKCNVMMSKCIDLSGQGLLNLPQSGCVHNIDAYNFDEWGGYLDVTLEDMTGVTCTCGEDACNDPRDHRGLYCYTCLNVTILESDRQPNSSVMSLYDKQVEQQFQGVDPGFCDPPSLVKCSEKETTCLWLQSVVEGEYYGIHGKADVRFFKCLDLSQAGMTTLSQTGCLINMVTFDKDEWGGYLGFTFTEDFTGVACTCDETACNPPDDEHATLCSSCRDIDVKFRDKDLNKKMEIGMVMNVFEPNTPLCPYSGEVECVLGGMCTTLNATIHGKYDTQSGTVTIIHHDCMAAVDLTKYGLDLTSQCVPATENVLVQLYGDVIIKPFSSVDKIEGSLCNCNTDLCNLPTRPLITPTEASGARSQMLAFTMAMVVIIAGTILNV